MENKGFKKTGDGGGGETQVVMEGKLSWSPIVFVSSIVLYRIINIHIYHDLTIISISMGGEINGPSCQWLKVRLD